MKRRLIALITALVLSLFVLGCLAAYADTYILHTPTKDQIQEAEAIQIACDFITELSGVEITGIYSVVDGMKVKNKAETAFGPGYQYYVDTNDDCWMLRIRNETSIQPRVLVHGTTGEVLYWEYSDIRNDRSYINMLPCEKDLPYEEAVQIAVDRFTQTLDGVETIDADKLIVQSAFAAAHNWNSLAAAWGDAPAWNITLQYGEPEIKYIYSMLINADNRMILDDSLFNRKTDGVLTE